MTLEDYIRETRALIKSFRDHADALEEQLQTTLGLHPDAVPKGPLIRKPNTWRTADAIERLLEFGEKTMKRDELTQTLVERKLGRAGDGADDKHRHQYANEAIRRGLQDGYLSENGDGVIHWVPGVRKSLARKRF